MATEAGNRLKAFACKTLAGVLWLIGGEGLIEVLVRGLSPNAPHRLFASLPFGEWALLQILLSLVLAWLGVVSWRAGDKARRMADEAVVATRGPISHVHEKPFKDRSELALHLQLKHGEEPDDTTARLQERHYGLHW